jgi:hypothetical protein
MRNSVIKRIVLGLLRWFAVTSLPMVFLTFVWCATLGAFDYWTIAHSSFSVLFTGLCSIAGILTAIGIDEDEHPDY